MYTEWYGEFENWWLGVKGFVLWVYAFFLESDEWHELAIIFFIFWKWHKKKEAQLGFFGGGGGVWLLISEHLSYVK